MFILILTRIHLNIEPFVNLMRRTFRLDLETRHTVPNSAAVNQMVSFLLFIPSIAFLVQIQLIILSLQYQLIQSPMVIAVHW